MRAFTFITIVATIALQAFADVNYVATSTTPQLCSFLSYCAMFNKHYSSTAELNMRFGIFLASNNFITNYPPSSFEMTLNHFADRTDLEKQAKLIGHHKGSVTQ